MSKPGMLIPHLNHRFSVEIQPYPQLAKFVKKFTVNFLEEKVYLDLFQPVTEQVFYELSLLCGRKGTFDIKLDQHPQEDNNNKFYFKGCQIVDHNCEYSYEESRPTIHHLIFSYQYLEA
jgi:hypothetical protein